MTHRTTDDRIWDTNLYWGLFTQSCAQAPKMRLRLDVGWYGGRGPYRSYRKHCLCLPVVCLLSNCTSVPPPGYGWIIRILCVCVHLWPRIRVDISALTVQQFEDNNTIRHCLLLYQLRGLTATAIAIVLYHERASLPAVYFEVVKLRWLHMCHVPP